MLLVTVRVNFILRLRVGLKYREYRTNFRENLEKSLSCLKLQFVLVHMKFQLCYSRLAKIEVIYSPLMTYVYLVWCGPGQFSGVIKIFGDFGSLTGVGPTSLGFRVLDFIMMVPESDQLPAGRDFLAKKLSSLLPC